MLTFHSLLVDKALPESLILSVQYLERLKQQKQRCLGHLRRRR